ncbi:MAG: zinc metalloprotease [bacterium]|nr:zinc metalloprotease [bacterium]
MHISRLFGAVAATTLASTLLAQHPDTRTLLRCGVVHGAGPTGAGIDSPDCNFNNTNPSAQYAPTTLMRIPVVVHVVQRTNGQGNLSNALVQSQIDVLNEDFRARAGTPGANGVDSKIEFFLATTDPQNQPTNGIVRHTNNTWFNDSGNYWSSTAWDTSRYLNIYTNNTGALGYVPDLPQGGGVLGTTADRVVCNYASFGRPAIGGPPYNTGRTATHEVGHYLGLFHTFNSGCGGGNCYTSGDRICDTPAESQPRYGCPVGISSCGTTDPIRNYMDYTDDTCMQGFTQEQVRRMRCTLGFYRSQLAQPAGPLASATVRNGTGNLNGNYTATAPVLGQTANLTVITLGTGFTASAVYGYLGQGSTPFNGYEILVDFNAPLILSFPFTVSSIAAGWTFNVPNDQSIAGLPVATQGVLFGTTVGFTNAVDLVLGN